VLPRLRQACSRCQGGDRAVIFGQDKVIEQALITLLCGGHALLIGLPGLAKTKLADTMGTVLGLDARRIQFTPDLMPSIFSAPKYWRKRRPAGAISVSFQARSSPSSC